MLVHKTSCKFPKSGVSDNWAMFEKVVENVESKSCIVENILIFDQLGIIMNVLCKENRRESMRKKDAQRVLSKIGQKFEIFWGASG